MPTIPAAVIHTFPAVTRRQKNGEAVCFGGNVGGLPLEAM